MIDCSSTSGEPLLCASPLDSQRFGLRVFRGILKNVDERALLREMIEGSADIAIIRTPAGSAPQLHRLARYGMAPIHADTLVYYQASLADYAPKPLRNEDLVFSEATPDDKVELDALVATTFDGYVSHYHANPRLSPGAILAGYAEWASGYISREVAGKITWTARRKGRIVAFACCAFDEQAQVCEGVLYGVHPDHAGGGLYGDLIRHTQREFRDRGFVTMKVSTQIWNLAVQKVWAREGFALNFAYDTYHINAMLSAGELLVDRELVFDSEQVRRFAEITGDDNAIHLDDRAAKNEGFEARITHGMLAGGELSRIFGTDIPGPGTLFLRSDFVFMRPIYCGRPHRLHIRYLAPPSAGGHIPAVATIRDAAGRICLLCYSDLLKRS
ncbi:acetyltransferase family protein [Lysobacter antibioticus]|uniref:bifunctional GNAT family N-acetyltransferase/hotdog fold thioesterase n=1 Tax=Lysobacter antibioticus TaxID=84531 RepID=UPI00072273BA|nr:bifunctional GNAT family N-acetyltransferase/hotdog fold thioesterase [Lysobacter antibioticus]ALN62942.1 acetyltransferase family protein [Lysobacter antibioticus]